VSVNDLTLLIPQLSFAQRLEECSLIDAFFDKEVVSTNKKFVVLSPLQVLLLNKPSIRAKSKALHRLTHVVHQLDNFVGLCRIHRIARQVEVQALGQVMYLLNAALVNQLLQNATLCKAGCAFSIKVRLNAIHLSWQLTDPFCSRPHQLMWRDG